MGGTVTNNPAINARIKEYLFILSAYSTFLPLLSVILRQLYKPSGNRSSNHAFFLAFVSLLLLLNLDSLRFSILIAYLYLLLVPSTIALQVRRMHDVGKSGWFILIPLYNLYLFVQPSLEKGRIPNWILAEKVSLGFVGILVLSLFSGDFGTNLGGLVLWSLIYLAIHRRNQKQNPKDNSNPL